MGYTVSQKTSHFLSLSYLLSDFIHFC